MTRLINRRTKGRRSLLASPGTEPGSIVLYRFGAPRNAVVVYAHELAELRFMLRYLDQKNEYELDHPYGSCDCGASYDAASRTDHDADTGQCWACSDRDLDSMTETEWNLYLEGN